MQTWNGPADPLGVFIAGQTSACLSVYREDPTRVEEDAAIEVTAAEGGYGRKQLFELLQNATDALRGSAGRIDAVLTRKTLYVANGGRPFSEVGAQSILASHLSRKSGEQIGQFGLGFKSVTAISDHVGVFSRTASFEFDRTYSEEIIRAAGIDAPRFPMLRLARVLEPTRAEDDDQTLSSLMSWASTVIRVSLRTGYADLAEDVKKFPASYLLFSPAIAEMRLEDRAAGLSRSMHRSHGSGGEVEIKDNQDSSRWIVESVVHRPSRAAMQDAGQAARRPTVEVSWAMPVSGGRGVGEIWAYFPTSIRMTLSGIVNAPWKLSSDRLAMVPGAYNEELLTQVLPSLVARGLTRGASTDDPGAVLDALPSRDRESRSWADDRINDPIFKAVSRVACAPDLTGTARRPAEMFLHPPGLPLAWKQAWSTSAPEAWAHHSVDRTPARRLKAERLFAEGRGSVAGLTSWVEAVAQGRGAVGSANALKLAALIAETDRNFLEELRVARIVLLEDGSMSRPERGRVFLRNSDEDADHDFIHADLAVIPGVGESLAALGIEMLNPAGELRAALQAKPQRPSWAHIWALTRRVDVETALVILHDELPGPLTRFVQARMKSGKWRPLDMCFLGGEVIPRDGSRDADYLIDTGFHAHDEVLLDRCGAVSSPRFVRGLPDEPWLTAYKAKHAEKYSDELPGRPIAPDRMVVSGPDVPWPLETLPLLSELGRAALTSRVLDLAAHENWSVMYPANSQIRPKPIPNPAARRIHMYGSLPTTIGPVDPGICLSPDSELPDSFPKAQVSSRWAQVLRLPLDCRGWSDEGWSVFLRDTEIRRPTGRAAAYAIAARSELPGPKMILAQRSTTGTTRLDPREVAITEDPNTYSSLLLAGVPALLADSEEDRDDLCRLWGLADCREMLREEIVATPDGEPTLLLDRFPPLRVYDRDIEELDALRVQTCSSIDILLSTPKGQEAKSATFHRSENVIHVLNGDERQVLERVGAALRVTINVRSILDQMDRQARNTLRVSIRSEDDLAKKLVLAVGPEVLKARLPRTAVDELQRGKGSELSSDELAELALSVHGYLILSELKRELSERGLEPPKAWAGSREARRFVDGLGFPPEYAGFPGANLSATLEVDGPVALDPLHDYQELVVDRIRALLTVSSSEKRGMVTLPTGAGKTRVAVEAVVRLVSDGALTGPVVWIGQSEELCEQAVQAWAYVWRAVGNGSLMLSRFWRGNEVSEASPGTFQVVVATIDKLREAINKTEYEWLKSVGLIIVDEAHTSIAPSYTNVFRWLGGESITTRMTTPLLGLTATAYRGHSEEETRRLIGRYGQNKLDDRVFGDAEPYHYLQERGVLAQVSQRVLDGMNIAWTPELEKHLKQFGTLPSNVEANVSQNYERNQVILESVTSHPPDWPILLFASSVEHARALAAEFSYYGVAARPISGATDPALRRRYIQQFAEGDIRVLTNYNVLTQGFDAPRVQAVYVTRPTFSPNLYQQMIGRGLRGPLNGGSDEVLIVNVADNLEQYGGRLAFHHFDYLWRGDDA